MTSSYGSGDRTAGDVHGAYRAQASQHFGAPQTISEHRSIVVFPDEEVVFAADFTSSPILRHIKTGLVVTKDRVIVRCPQYLFFFIKVGYAESSTPIRRVCEVTTGRLLSRRRITSALMFGVFGLFLLMSGVSGLGDIFGALATLLALVFLAFAAFQAWMARSLGLTVTHTGGGHLHVDVDKLEFGDMVAAGTAIQQLVLDATSSPSSRPSAPSPSPVFPTPAPAPSPESSSAQFAPQTPPPARPTPNWAPVPQPQNTSPRPPAAPPTIWRG